MEKKELSNSEKKHIDIEKLNIGNHVFRNYWKQYVDKDLQYTAKISELEQLIMKPQVNENGIYSLSEEELEQYEKIDISKLKETAMNMKTIVMCKITQKTIQENKEKILQTIRKRKQKEEENER